MKKILLSLAATAFFVTTSFGQTNNPFDQVGVDVVQVAQVVYKDYLEGKIKDISQETIDYYFKEYLPHYDRIELGDFNTIFGALKGATNESIIENSKFSEEGKRYLKKTLENYSITKLVDEVKASKMAENEKESILCVLAINYHLIKPFFTKNNQIENGKGPHVQSIMYEDLTLPNLMNTDGTFTVIWGGLGFITGNAICGLGCGILGGVVGLIFGDWLDGRVRDTLGSLGSGSSSSSSGSYNGGNYGGGSSWGPQP